MRYYVNYCGMIHFTKICVVTSPEIKRSFHLSPFFVFSWLQECGPCEHGHKVKTALLLYEVQVTIHVYCNYSRITYCINKHTISAQNYTTFGMSIAAHFSHNILLIVPSAMSTAAGLVYRALWTDSEELEDGKCLQPSIWFPEKMERLIHLRNQHWSH